MRLNPLGTWVRFVAVAIIVLAPMAGTRGQTTTSATTAASTQSAGEAGSTAEQPPEQSDWAMHLERIAQLLAGNDLRALQRLMEPLPVIRRFAGDATETPERLLGTTTGSKVLGVHAYDRVPTALADDLAADFSSAGDVVPQHVRDGMQNRDAASAKRANETAGQWLAHVLQPQKDELTGVIVLWPENRSRAITAAPRRATFVLVKAQEVNGDYVLRQITFGDPLETPK